MTLPFAIAILAFYFAVNLVLFCLMGSDKARARKNQWRIPESTLIGMAFLGGALGGVLGMRMFRHKTQKLKFQICFPLALILHGVLWSYVIWRFYLH